MESSLPINIIASQNLLTRFSQLNGVISKQEAQINFQTLAAGWYEDEQNITSIDTYLIGADEFQQQLVIEHLGNRHEISDDVVSYSHKNNITCFIAITEVESNLLDKEPKLLSGYLTMKIKKVINEIAKQQNLLALSL